MILRTLTRLIMCMMLTAPAWAVEPGTPPKDQAGGMMGSQGNMGEMMTQCQARCQAQMQSAEQLMQTLEEAKNSNDPARMRAAIEQTQASLRQARKDMSECAGMMKKMNGSMGMGMMGQTTGSTGMMRSPGTPQ